MTTANLKKLLLQHDGRIIACGYLWEIKSKVMGAGVYRVFLKRSNAVAPGDAAPVSALPKFEDDMREIVTAVRESEK